MDLTFIFVIAVVLVAIITAVVEVVKRHLILKLVTCRLHPL